jgi:alpha-amylase
MVLFGAALTAACSHATSDGRAPDAASSVNEPNARAADAGTAVPSPASEGWWREATFYEIFVRSFADSDGDGIGDFRGLTAKLDVLNDGDPNTDTDLGVTGLWLMPVFASPSYHGYDVTDYRRINPDYGTEADFDAFLAAAHARGIRVILDLMINHSSSQHPWFLDARSGPDADHRDFYLWRDDDPGWTQPWSPNPVWHPTESGYYYGLFWGGMPDLDLANPEVEAEVLAIMDHWLDRGVDGFRLDAARHYFESDDGVLVDQPEVHPFMRRLRRAVAAEHPDALFVAEVWSDVSTVAPYFGEGGDEFQLAFGFDSAGSIVNAARDRAVGDFERHVQNLATYADPDYEAPFITNHDMVRAMQQLGGDAGAMRVAAAALFALPGTPFVYYGEEIGMRGGTDRRDEDKRTPMRWTGEAPGYGFTTAARMWHGASEPDGVSVAGQRGQPGSLWTLYRDLIALREGPLAEGPATIPAHGGGRGTTAVLRTRGDARVLVVLNFDDAPSGPFTVAVDGTPEVRLAEGLDGTPEARDGEIALGGLAPRGFAFIALR